MSNLTDSSKKLPDLAKVFQLWDEHGMLPNIRLHSQQVCRVALALWQWLGEAGLELDRQTVKMGALLHDVAKTCCLGKPHLHHNLEGQRILDENGYYELGVLVAKHVNLGSALPLDEAALVFYADKRVVGDQIVSVMERYQYIMKVYGCGKPGRIQFLQQDERLTYQLEEHIFSIVTSFNTQRLISAAAQIDIEN